MLFSVLSLFPELFYSFTKYGVIRRGFEGDLCSLNLYNPRDYALDGKVDDKPFGGGVGMVMKAEPLKDAMLDALAYQTSCSATRVLRVLLSPQGKKLDNNLIDKLLEYQGLIFVCGRYRGIDQRFIDNYIDMEISLGDFIVSGGELPAMMIMEAMIRKIPGVLNDQESKDNDSFTNVAGLLDCPHYTLPRNFDGVDVPDVLVSGDHAKIAAWRDSVASAATLNKRPDLVNIMVQGG